MRLPSAAAAAVMDKATTARARREEAWRCPGSAMPDGGVLQQKLIQCALARVEVCAESLRLPLPNSSSIFWLKAGMSAGFLLETRPSSTTTSRSTQLAPAFFRSVFKEGHDVTVRPFTTSASISVHGP